MQLTYLALKARIQREETEATVCIPQTQLALQLHPKFIIKII